MRNCYNKACDNVSQITKTRMKYLAKIGRTVLLNLINLAEMDCSRRPEASSAVNVQMPAATLCASLTLIALIRSIYPL